MIKAILFDLDGTLINTNDLIIKSYQYTLKKHLSMEISPSDVAKYFGEPLKKTLSRYDENNVSEMIATYKAFNEENHDILCKDFEGIKEALIAIKEKGLKVAVVTSKREKMAQRGLKFLGIDVYIDVMVTPESTEKHKPDGEPALKACEILGISPEEAIMVGDSHYDILCGKSAGCFTCAVNYSELPLELLKSYNPDYFVHNIMELVNIVSNFNEKEEAV